MQLYKRGRGLIVKTLHIWLVLLVSAAGLRAGQTWTMTGAPITNWTAVATSADGTRLVAAAGYSGPSLIYVSTNGGTNWTPSGAPIEYWKAIASSADGSKLVAVTDGSIIGGSPATLWSSVD